MKCIIPSSVQPGDVIGLFSPSSGTANLMPHRVENGVKALESLGYRVKIAKNALKRSGYVSGTPKERVSDLHALFLDPEIKVVMAMIGGNHSNQLLKHIDYDLIRQNPKIFIGYSDNTVLHYALYSKAGLRTYYGPCLITEMGEFPEPLSFTVKYFEKAINGERIGVLGVSDEWTDEILDWSTKSDLERPRTLLKNEGLNWLHDGEVEGEIFGGCIPSINHLLGTSYWVDPADKIFFLDIPEGHVFGEGMSLADVDAFLTDLDNVGLFASIKGLIVGRPYRYTEEQKAMFEVLIDRFTKDYNYPVVLDVDIGHTTPMVTIPLGARIKINSQMGIIEVLDSGTIKEMEASIGPPRMR